MVSPARRSRGATLQGSGSQERRGQALHSLAALATAVSELSPCSLLWHSEARVMDARHTCSTGTNICSSPCGWGRPG